jgi:probable addiction module antidote protein
MKATNFNNDLKESLTDPEYMEYYLNEALNAYYEDKDLDMLLHCLKPVIEAQGTIKDFADRVKIKRTYLYRIFNCQVHPEFTTLANIFEALGLEIRVAQKKAA